MRKCIFIHGAFGTERDLEPLSRLCKGLQIDLMLLPFHGREAGPRFDYQSLRGSLLERLQDQRDYSIFGYSMGGYLALDLSSQGLICPDSVFTYGTRFFWNSDLVQKISKNMRSENLIKNLPKYVKELERMHGTSWPNVVSDMIRAMDDISNKPITLDRFLNLDIKVKLVIGENDTLANIEETKLISTKIKNSDYEIIPAAVHDVAQLNDSQLRVLAKSILSI